MGSSVELHHPGQRDGVILGEETILAHVDLLALLSGRNDLEGATMNCFERLTPNKVMKRTLESGLLSLPLQSAPFKCRLSQR